MSVSRELDPSPSSPGHALCSSSSAPSFSDSHFPQNQTEFYNQLHLQEMIEVIEMSETPTLVLAHDDKHIIHGNLAFLVLFGVTPSLLASYQSRPWMLLDVLFHERFLSILNDSKRSSIFFNNASESSHTLVGLNQKNQNPFDVKLRAFPLKMYICTTWQRVDASLLDSTTSSNNLVNFSSTPLVTFRHPQPIQLHPIGWIP